MFLTSRLTRGGTLAAIASAALLAGQAGAETVATVNGAAIDSAVLNQYLESRLQKTAGEATPEERQSVLAELTDIYLLSTQPRAKALEDDPEIKAQMEIQYRGLLAQAVASDFMAENAATEDEIFEEYTRQISRNAGQEFKARHILVETQAKASEMIAELDGGADFQALAREHSTGPSGPNGGDLGWFAPDQMVAPFAEAVKTLEDGSYSKEPVQTQFGWHVILKEDSRDREPPTLESVRQIVKQQVETRKFQAYLDKLRQAKDTE